MTETDLSDWLTVTDAAAQIGCSTRTIERLAAAKKLEQRLRPQKGSPDVAVFSPESVAEEAVRRRPAPSAFVLPAGPHSRSANGNGRPHPDPIDALALPASDDPIRQLFAAALRAVLSPPSAPVSASVAATLYLTLPEAVALSGLSAWVLRQEMIDGRLPFKREPRSRWTKEDRGWRIRRKDLEAL